MKKVIQAFLYFIITLLVLQVIKKSVGYYTAVIISSVQTFIILGFIIVPLFFRLTRTFIARIAAAKAVAVCLFILVIAAFEGLCTSWLYHPAAIPGFLQRSYTLYYDLYARHIIQLDEKSAVYNDQLFYTLKPGSRFDFSNYEFNTQYTTNSKGLRDDESSLTHPSIICLGDSYTMGWGVQQDSTLSSQLEKMTGVKVLNAGMSSYGTAREIKSLQQLDTSAMRYLLVQYSDNDFTENNICIQNKYVLPISSPEVYRSAVRSHTITTVYYPGKHFLNLLQLYLKEKINPLLPNRRVHTAAGKKSGTIEQSKAFLDVLAKAPVNFGRTKVIVFRLAGPTLLNSRFEEITDSLARQPYYRQLFAANVYVLPLKQVINKDDYYILDPHLTSGGQQKVATKIYWLMQQLNARW